MRLDAAGEPDAGADHRVVAHDRPAAENRGVGVDDDAVFERRMPLLPANQLALSVGREAEGAEGHALVELHVLADVARLADDDAGAVIDEEIAADRGAGVNVDAGAAMSPLAHHAGNERDADLVQQVSEAIDGDRFETGVAKNDFRRRFAGGVAVVGGLNVGGEDFAQLWKLIEELQRLRLAEGFEILGGVAVARGAGVVPQRAADLRRQAIVETIDQVADVVADVAVVEPLAAAIAGEHDLVQFVDRGDDLVVPRQRAVIEMVHLPVAIVRGDDARGDVGQLVFQAEVGGHGGFAS